jgi:hypothetical protein
VAGQCTPENFIAWQNGRGKISLPWNWWPNCGLVIRCQVPRGSPSHPPPESRPLGRLPLQKLPNVKPRPFLLFRLRFAKRAGGTW